MKPSVYSVESNYMLKIIFQNVYKINKLLKGSKSHGQHSLNEPQRLHKYVDQEIFKRSAGVAPEMNLGNQMNTSDEAHMQEIYFGFGTQGRRHQKSKTGRSVAPQKGLMSS